MTETSEISPAEEKPASIAGPPVDYTNNQPERNIAFCLHCGLPNPSAESKFCCAGCEAIYRTINQLGLQEFYRYRDIRPVQGLQAAAPNLSNYLEFDSADAIELLQICSEGNLCTVSLQLTGIHCAGCLWLLERLPLIEPAIIKSKLIFGEGRLILTYDSELIRLSQIAQRLNSLGYPAESPVIGQSLAKSPLGEDRLLLRIGVAGFSAMNTMMLAVSLFQGFYTGIDPAYGNLFRLTSLGLALPAVLYSAYPFYRASFSGIRLGRIHVDLPISIAIIGVFLLSALNALTGREAVYFDSVCTLIFLLLVGRYIQSRAIARAQVESRAAWTILPLSARCRVDGVEKEVLTRSVQEGDEVIVLGGERLPIDGRIIEGDSSLDVSVITGESKPIAAGFGDEVLAGSFNIDRRIVVRASASGKRSRLAGLIARLDQMRGERPDIVTLTDKLSSWFLTAVITVSCAAFVYWVRFSVEEAVDCVVAFLIVSCPCALGLAAPTILSLAVGRAARRGILIKTESALERASQVEHYFFDKTGTLTSGEFSVVEFQPADPHSLAGYRDQLAALAAVSPRHPVSRAVFAYLTAEYPAGAAAKSGDYSDQQIYGGRGVSMRAGGRTFRFGSAAWHQQLDLAMPEQVLKLLERADSAGGTTVLFSIDEKIEAAILLKDTVTDQARRVVADLVRCGKEITILSGDTPAAVRSAALALGLAPEAALGALLPENKAEIVASCRQKKAFVGDGVNDAPAMQAADLAISLHGAIESTLEVADIVVPSGDIGRIGEVLFGSKRAMAVIRRALRISAGYNISAGALALQGFVNPFVAALIMPISSATVISIALLSRTFDSKK